MIVTEAHRKLRRQAILEAMSFCAILWLLLVGLGWYLFT